MLDGRTEGVGAALGERARAQRDWWRLLVRHHPWNAVGALSAIGGLLAAGLGQGLGAVFAIVGLVAVVVDVGLVRRKVRGLQRVRVPLPTPVVPDGWVVDALAGDHLVRSDTVDRERPWDREAALSPRPFRLPPDLAELAPEVVGHARRQSGGPLFDGACVRLADDLRGTTGPVALERTGYFDLLTSNYMAGHQWLRRGARREAVEVTPHLYTAGGALRTLGQGDMADAIGVSSVLLTADGTLVLVVQGLGARSSPGLLAPSASGGLEPRDLTGETGFDGALRAGMTRELCEESGLLRRADVDLDTRVLGFGRWLEKGAKPEFFGVTRTSVVYRDLGPRITLGESPYVHGHREIKPSEVAAFLAGPAPGTGAAAGHVLGGADASLPLAACLARLWAFAASPEGRAWLPAPVLAP